MTHDQGERWDNRRPVASPGASFGVIECQALAPWWRGPTNPTQAKICDDAMVALGAILAEHELRDIEKRNGF